MTSEYPKTKGGKIDLRQLFRRLEKSKNDPDDQCQALVDLSTAFILKPERRNEAAFKQTLANTVRWYFFGESTTIIWQQL